MASDGVLIPLLPAYRTCPMTCRWNAKLFDCFSDLFGRYVPVNVKGGFVPLYCCYLRHCLVPRGVHSVATKTEVVKILHRKLPIWKVNTVKVCKVN